jgi:tRNA nucleotidyltransferase (CCA-adding enzyme)
VEIAAPSVLVERVRALPGAPELLERLDGAPGVHLVGGAVRDLLLGRTPTELDLLVEGDPAPIVARLGGAQRRHDRFGTSTVTLDGFRYDIAQARRETYAHPGALPTVTPASVAEDLLRRDFTVNAAAIALTGRAAGTLTSAPWALPDLEARLLRVLHAQSFRDDPTRLLRMARYAARLEFGVEPGTLALADAAIAAGALDRVSGPRIGNELRLLARENEPVEALAALDRFGLSGSIASGLGPVDPALGARALALLPADGRRDRLALAVAFAGSLTPFADELAPALDRMAFDAADRDAILEAATGARGLAEVLGVARSPAGIAAALAGARAETVALAGALGASDQAREWLERLRHVRLEIDGEDLLMAGIERGPRIGAGLRAALAAKLDGRVSGRESELAEALRAATATG